MLVTIFEAIVRVLVTSAWNSIKERRTLAKVFDERKSRLVFAMSTNTAEGHPFAVFDAFIQEQSVICANGHTYAFGEFYCTNGVDTAVVYDEVTTRSETRSTLVDALDGFRASDTAVRSVREDSTLVPRIESREKQRFGCPACKTSIYSFVSPAAGEYIRCHTIDKGGTFVAHWYHRSLDACIVCDAAAFSTFKATWYATNMANNSCPSDLNAFQQAEVPPGVEDPLDALPAAVAGRVRLFCRSSGCTNSLFEKLFVGHIHQVRKKLTTASGGTSATDEVRIWADALSEACRSMNLDEVLGLESSERRYLLALVAGRTSPPSQNINEDWMSQESVDMLLSSTVLPQGVTEAGMQYLHSCRDRQTRDGWFADEDFSALDETFTGKY